MAGVVDGNFTWTSRSPVGQSVGRPHRSSSRERIGNQGNARPANGSQNHGGPNHDKGRSGLIPEVPRIPDRFLSHNEDRDSGPAQNPEIEKVDLSLIPGPYTRYLPNCTVGQPKKVQVFTNAMMQAYVSMRGNGMGGEYDPLFEWIRRREELAQASKHPIHHKRDVSRMLDLIDTSFYKKNAGGDSPRDCIFEVYRPDFAHIKPPQDMDLSEHIFADCCNDFEWEWDDNDDPNDDEANAPSGRISPCTFMEWSKDCVRWDADINEHKVPLEVTASYRRMRPNHPIPSTQQRRGPHKFENQYDILDGDEISPLYDVPSCPSIIYSPPGIDSNSYQDPWFLERYKRMLPLMDRQLRAEIYGVPAIPSLNEENENYTPTEVDAAAAVVPELQGRQGPEIEFTLRHQWAAIKQAEGAEKYLHKHTQIQDEQIKQLQFDRKHLNLYMPALHQQLAIRDDKIRAERERKRREKIRAYVVNHAHEAQNRLDLACNKLSHTRAKVNENMLRIEGLHREIRKLCNSAGVRDPGHAYAVLMGEDTEMGDVVAGGFDIDGGYGSGSGYGGNVDPHSTGSGSWLRVEEAYNRIMAELAEEKKAHNPEKSYRSGGRDSAISGVGDEQVPDESDSHTRFQHQDHPDSGTEHGGPVGSHSTKSGPRSHVEDEHNRFMDNLAAAKKKGSDLDNSYYHSGGSDSTVLSVGAEQAPSRPHSRRSQHQDPLDISMEFGDPNVGLFYTRSPSCPHHDDEHEHEPLMPYRIDTAQQAKKGFEDKFNHLMAKLVVAKEAKKESVTQNRYHARSSDGVVSGVVERSSSQGQDQDQDHGHSDNSSSGYGTQMHGGSRSSSSRHGDHHVSSSSRYGTRNSRSTSSQHPGQDHSNTTTVYVVQWTDEDFVIR